MRVYVYPAGLDGCGYYRLIWPALALQAQGHDVTVVMPGDRAQDRYALTAQFSGDELLRVACPSDADVIVLQRVTHVNLARAVGQLRRQGIAVVVDMDDDLTCIDPQNPAYGWLHPRRGSDHTWVNATTAARSATWVTTSTPALQKVYAPPGRGTVLYNCLEDRTLDGRVAGVPDTGRFGWTGSLYSHPNDPLVTGNSVARLVREGHGFHMVGNPAGVAKVFRISDEEDSTDMTTSGILDSTVWAEALSALHVGIAPLADTMFNRAKSWLKPLELAAAGVPCVVSPRAEYRRIHARGVGVLAERPKDFYREVRRLMTDDAWHAEVRERSRAAVADLGMTANAWRWAEAWTSAYEFERTAVPV